MIQKFSKHLFTLHSLFLTNDIVIFWDMLIFLLGQCKYVFIVSVVPGFEQHVMQRNSLTVSGQQAV